MFVPPNFGMDLQFEKQKRVPLNKMDLVESCQLVPANVAFSSIFLYLCLTDG